MVRYEIDEVTLAWTDNGNKMWAVGIQYDGQRGYYKTFAKDEIDAYNIIKKTLAEKEQADD